MALAPPSAGVLGCDSPPGVCDCQDDEVLAFIFFSSFKMYVQVRPKFSPSIRRVLVSGVWVEMKV